MEDDDEFGDLYSDVLLQFQPSSALNPPPEAPKHPSPKHPIDLNVQSDDDKILSGAPNPKPKFNFTFSQQTQNLVLDSTNSGSEPGFTQSSDSRRNSDQEVVKEDGLSEGVRNQASDFPESTGNRVLESGGDGKLQEMGPKPTDDAGIDFLVEERGDKDDVLAGKNEALIDKEENFVKFDIEEAEEPVIPGVSDAADHQGEGNDWDSDSDDDLNIVLNESNHGPMVMDGLVDEDDEDGDPLVIVTDSETGHLPMEEREWGEDAAQAADGERKESGEAVKVNGGAVVAPKIGYNSNFTYQPYHSQFKYVRPGAPLMPGAVPVGPAGAPGQVRPPVNMGPVGGFGRGDWRPTGIRNAFPQQKNLHPGFGMNAWGNNTAGRGFGSGLDFTLPSHKTIFEVDIASFEEKPWRLPGLDMSDFFNFGLNEESWKDYCKQLEQLRVETTMQSKIRVYESGRAEQEYDPDLPPELAAAAGIREISSENVNNVKSDGGQIDLAKGSSDVRPPVPIGRAIQVETSFVERLPSTDTRPLRIRDSDVIIEIVLQGSTDDSSLPGNDVTEQPDNGTSRENFRGGQGTNGEVAEEQNVLPIAYSVRKGEMVGRRSPVVNSIHDNVVERDSLLPYRLDSREQTSAYPGREVVTLHEGRQTKGRASERSPIMAHSGGTLDKGVLDNQKEDSVESVGGKCSNQLSSPVTVGSAEEPDIEHGDGLRGSCGMSDREEIPLDRTTLTDTHNAENPLPSVKKQKLSSRVEQSSDQEIGDGGDLKAARSSENSKARSDSSRDFHKLNDSVDEEVVQRGRPTRTGNMKRPHGEFEQSLRRKSHDERREVENHRIVEKGWDDSHSRRDLDPHSARHSHMKTEGLDRRKERENSEGIWQRRDDDPQRRRTRAEDTRNKVREREKMDKDEHLQLRKQLANGNSRGYQDKDVGSRPRERDDNLKSQYESMNDQYSKRRKEEDYLRRDGEKEEILHNHRENPSRRKRERDDALDLRKRDDQVRTRDDNHNSVRHKEDGWIHRERDQMHRVKQSHEESLSKREREERREGVRKSGRAVEEKTWVPHARAKDEYKGTSDIDYDFKDSGRHNEQHKRRIEDGSVSQHRGREDVHARVKDEYKDTSDIDYDLKETSRHNEHLKRRVEDGSVSQRRGREDVHARVKDEYKGTSDIDYDLKDTGRHNERLKRRVDDGSLPQHRGREEVHSTRGSLLNKDERMSRQERESTRRDRGVGGSDNNRAQEKKHKENTRSKDSEGRDRNSVGPATRNQEDQSGHMNEPAILTGTTEQGKHKEDASSDDEQRDSRRGRSKLERWTSHKEMDFGIDSKSSSSSAKIKEIGKYKNGAGKLPEESAKTVETTDDPHPSGDQKDKKDEKSVDGRHLDTVAKLKQRSERFKLPMPSDKEAMVIKKMESEPLLPSPQSGAREDSEIKSERPPRKRRWISN